MSSNVKKLSPISSPKHLKPLMDFPKPLENNLHPLQKPIPNPSRLKPLNDARLTPDLRQELSEIESLIQSRTVSPLPDTFLTESGTRPLNSSSRTSSYDDLLKPGYSLLSKYKPLPASPSKKSDKLSLDNMSMLSGSDL